MIITEYPPFSWSLSRKNISDLCMRKYFYNYYGSHNGWIDSYPEITRTIYKYKQMTTLDMSFGSLFHNSIKKYFQEYTKNNDLGESFFKETITEGMRDVCLRGTNLKMWNIQPKQHPLLMEYYYWGGFSSVIGKRNVEKIKQKINNLYLIKNAKTINELYNGDFEKIIEIDESFQRSDVGSLLEKDIKVFSKIDLLFVRKSDNKYIIVDWKTSPRKDNDSPNELLKDDVQMYLYAYYVNKKYGISYSDILGRLEYVVSGETIEINFSKETEKIIKQIMLNNINYLTLFVEDKDLNKNIPKDISFFNMSLEEKKCNYCSFKDLCKANC